MKRYNFLKNKVNVQFYKIDSRYRNKVFGIGFGKTGTTSLLKAYKNLGLFIAPQQAAELMIKDWNRRDFRKIINFCKSYVAFQDIPFSCPYTFIALDMAFPKSKFILTIRDNPEQWYESVINFHSKLWGNGALPNMYDLKNAEYLYKGWAYYALKSIFSTKDEDLYNKDTFIDIYNRHNSDVIDYFKFRKEDLLVINVAESKSYQKLAAFLNKEVDPKAEFPWENKT